MKRPEGWLRPRSLSVGAISSCTKAKRGEGLGRVGIKIYRWQQQHAPTAWAAKLSSFLAISTLSARGMLWEMRRRRD
jgi:hypothetical protein